MAPRQKHYYIHTFENLQGFIYQQTPPTSDHASPILAIAVLSIMGTAFLLVGYYIFVNKCCLNRNQFIMLRWFTVWSARRNENSFIGLSPTMWNRGLDESVIREIPTFQYRREEGEDRSIYGCVVCLNEFQEQDVLRVLPNSSHAFHLDCLDIWFQGNANCPLCRTSISGTATKYPADHIIAPSSLPQGSQLYTDSLMGSDEDYIVIELGGEDDGVLLPPRQQERDTSREVQMRLRSRSPTKMEQKLGKLKPRKQRHVSIMGDEYIDVRGKDGQFSIQPLRRSFSLDSAVDRQLYSSVQAIIRQNMHHREITNTEESSNRGRRPVFPFVQGQGSRKTVFPVEFYI